MCGRYANTKVTTNLATLFDALDGTDGAWGPRYNIAPTTKAPIVRMSTSAPAGAGVTNQLGSRKLDLARWGLIPPWAKELSIGSRMFNARSETVQTSKAYRRPFTTRRALVPADGWFEWQKLPGGGKQPYFITRPGGVVFAGLWDSWGKGEERIVSFTILTCDSFGGLEEIHDRMPLILPPDAYAAWLGLEEADARQLLAGPDLEDVLTLETRRVSKAVGRVTNDGPELLEALEEDDPTEPTLPGL
ncbi:SOS response-associated peptidase [Natronoglycomyces albus]|uniref:Abasic site processing protein n=2 Tax=Natronoglycomyces albus TaxID=2811108 RepID=A0A895XQA2_9ACTN|nr:SOS response-associated peptidase [Natronoglycomyces albus]QSB04450.1 SOS response-associated peptidase [Natronoglycomyces albus]